MENKLTFTIAVDHLDTIKPRHFGDADKFLIYEYDNREDLKTFIWPTKQDFTQNQGSN
ncbi:MAG: hypothetical protein V5A59_10865 [Bacteroidales bacterium]|nr:hypothetical protein [Bacteroidales bacterium]MBS3776021.1 hypothetical protein [Bacteroidales bacterium]